MTHAYELVERQESAAAAHGRLPPNDPQAQIWWTHVTAPALVLGSTQREPGFVDDEACRLAGVDVVRRRSGGGAVLLIPGEVEWIDVIIPAGSAGWAADVHHPMRWLGEHLAAVLAAELAARGQTADVTVNEGGMINTAWSSVVCFDGLGPGEVLVDGRKLIGISQRRTRASARLQCSWHSRYDAAKLPSLLRPDVRPDPAELLPVATVDASVASALPAALLRRLSAAAGEHAGTHDGGHAGTHVSGHAGEVSG